MSAETLFRIPARLQALAATAMLLERLDQMPRGASAAQYRGLVQQLDTLLAEAEGEPMLLPLLDGLPSLSELHENRHYAEAGLCRSPLAASAQAERATHALLQQLRGTPWPRRPRLGRRLRRDDRHDS